MPLPAGKGLRRLYQRPRPANPQARWAWPPGRRTGRERDFAFRSGDRRAHHFPGSSTGGRGLPPYSMRPSSARRWPPGPTSLSETTAQVRGLAEAGRFRGVALKKPSCEAVRAASRLILVADGLGRTSLKGHGPFKPRIAAGSRVGLGCAVDGRDSKLATGTVSMSVGRAGYVGMVRVPDGLINVAAAVDAGHCASADRRRLCGRFWTNATSNRPRPWRAPIGGEQGSSHATVRDWPPDVYCFWGMRPVTSSRSPVRG